VDENLTGFARRVFDLGFVADLVLVRPASSDRSGTFGKCIRYLLARTVAWIPDVGAAVCPIRWKSEYQAATLGLIECLQR
jgi:hypothetical protein